MRESEREIDAKKRPEPRDDKIFGRVPRNDRDLYSATESRREIKRRLSSLDDKNSAKGHVNE